jgi:hypothetical protein
MGPTACGLAADLIDWIEGPHSDRGRPRCPTEAVVETLRFFVREGVQWRELRATDAVATDEAGDWRVAWIPWSRSQVPGIDGLHHMIVTDRVRSCQS